MLKFLIQSSRHQVALEKKDSLRNDLNQNRAHAKSEMNQQPPFFLGPIKRISKCFISFIEMDFLSLSEPFQPKFISSDICDCENEFSMNLS